MSGLNTSNNIIAAVVTPFSARGELHEESLRALIRHTLSLGVQGLYVCGTTGEGLLLSIEERMRALETAIAEADGSADVIVNISHMEFRQLMRLSQHASEVGADAVSILPPIYNSVTPDEVCEYFRQVLTHVRLPLTLYNIPHLTQRPLDDTIVAKLAEYPLFIGIKHSSEDTQMILRFKQVASGRLSVWSGRDAYYLGSLAMGADGAIGSSFQLVGDVFVAITEAFRAGNHELAMRLQQDINAVHARLMSRAPVKSIKRCLRLLGIDVGECRLPFQPLDSTDDDYFRETLTMIDRIRQKFKLPQPTLECVCRN